MRLPRRWVLVAVAVVTAVLAALAAWVVVRGTAEESPTATSSSPCTADDPCLDQPVTDQPGTDETATPGADPAASLTEVELLVTSSGWDSAQQRAWIAGDVPVVESDGTCTATLTRGDDQVEESVSAEAGPRTTTCAVEVDGARLASGDWLVTLSYFSGQHSAVGPEVSISIP